MDFHLTPNPEKRKKKKKKIEKLKNPYFFPTLGSFCSFLGKK